MQKFETLRYQQQQEEEQEEKFLKYQFCNFAKQEIPGWTHKSDVFLHPRQD